MKYEQFKDLDIDGKLNILYTLISNHLKHHWTFTISLLGGMFAIVAVLLGVLLT